MEHVDPSRCVDVLTKAEILLVLNIHYHGFVDRLLEPNPSPCSGHVEVALSLFSHSLTTTSTISIPGNTTSLEAISSYLCHKNSIRNKWQHA